MKTKTLDEQLAEELAARRKTLDEQFPGLAEIKVGDTRAAAKLTVAIISLAEEITQAEAEAAEFMAVLGTASLNVLRSLPPPRNWGFVALAIANLCENEKAAKLFAEAKSGCLEARHTIQKTSIELARDAIDKRPEILEAIIAVRHGRNDPDEHPYTVAAQNLDKVNSWLEAAGHKPASIKAIAGRIPRAPRCQGSAPP
jgi:hypothetical protein